VADILEQKRDELAGRLTELAPAVAEYERLTAAVEALASVASPSANGAAVPVPAPASRHRRRSRARRPASTAAARGTRGKAAPEAAATAKTSPRATGRRNGSGTRADEALARIEAKPGIAAPELAEAMGIKQPNLYRILSKLRTERKLRKKGRGWHLKKAAPTGA
jgi:hypothetical protein